MKALPPLLALLLLPLFIYWADWHYHQQLGPELLGQARARLAAPEFAEVRVSLDYLNARLEGRVAAPLQSFNAERLVAAIPGLRIADGDNQLRVAGSLTLARQNGWPLALGLLPETQREVMAGLAKRLDLITKDLSFHPQVEGALPLAQARLADLLESFFAVPGNRFVEFTADRIHLRGNATPAQRRQWAASLEQIAPGDQLDLELMLYPSVYHLPGYAVQSPLPSEQVLRLQRELRRLQMDASRPLEDQLPPVLSSLRGAPVEAVFVIGGHPTMASMASDLPRQWAERVRDALLAADIEAGRVQLVEFEFVGREPAVANDQAADSTVAESRTGHGQLVEILLH